MTTVRSWPLEGSPSPQAPEPCSTPSTPQPHHRTAQPPDSELKGSPSPSLTGLCHAFSAGNKADHGKALENPALTVLITAAGGKDNVDNFCAEILKSPAPGKPSEPGKPSQDQPTGKPGVPTPGYPTGKPSGH